MREDEWLEDRSIPFEPVEIRVEVSDEDMEIIRDNVLALASGNFNYQLSPPPNQTWSPACFNCVSVVRAIFLDTRSDVHEWIPSTGSIKQMGREILAMVASAFPACRRVKVHAVLTN